MSSIFEDLILPTPGVKYLNIQVVFMVFSHVTETLKNRLKGQAEKGNWGLRAEKVELFDGIDDWGKVVVTKE